MGKARSKENTDLSELAKNIFTRIEEKYVITSDKLDAIAPVLAQHMHGDDYGMSTVCSMYFDTPDMRVIRASVDAKAYKEKLRLRCYGVPTQTSNAFVELKKKYLGIVYKRRFKMPYANAVSFLTGLSPAPDTQMGREVDYFLRFYPDLQPMIDIFCERVALFGNDDEGLRLTVDRNIRYRMDELDLTRGSRGTPILPEDTFIMEIKSFTAFPLWLTRLLDENGIYPQKFSKYRHAYELELKKRLNR